MKTIKSLLENQDRIFICLDSVETGKTFLKNAEKEGFTFGDGVKPTKRKPDSIFAVHSDMTISYVGYIGHIWLGHLKNDKRYKVVDYTEFIES